MADAVTITGRLEPAEDRVLTPGALRFLAELSRRFSTRIDALLEARQQRQTRFDSGERPDFLPETRSIREASWRIAPVPAELEDRRVEITGPVERKMIINALNSGASAFMADFEDSTSPTWHNLLEGQAHLMDAVRRTLRFEAPDSGKIYELVARPAILFIRPRGLHLREEHVATEGRPMPGALFDFGLYLYHNARELLSRGSAPYFYLPKLESHLEARLWNDVFVHAEAGLGLEPGTIKATVLIETLPAAFEMNEILYELREHSAGLNCGRWDYIFSFIKKLRSDPGAVLPDRAEVTMDRGFLRAYSELLIQTCHRRGAHAMGGMAAQIPIKGDPEANQRALAKVRADKLREVTSGHDGTWVAHPALVPVARAVFDEHMPEKTQIAHARADVQLATRDLLCIPEGTRSEAGLRHNVRIGISYLEAWLRGNGCIPLDHLMEDAATAEISRAQVWQWIRHRASLDSGRVVTKALVGELIRDETKELARSSPLVEAGLWREASALFEQLSLADGFEEFLTLPAYRELLARGA
jgi:malate synthase